MKSDEASQRKKLENFIESISVKNVVKKHKHNCKINSSSTQNLKYYNF